LGAGKKAIIRPQDVVGPLFVLLGLNLVILTTLTAVAPLTWERPILIDGKLGPYRGSCYHLDPINDSKYTAKVVFASLLLTVNFVAMLMTNYQFWRARKLPTLFNETYYIGMTNIVLFECVFAGVPLLAALKDDHASFAAVLCVVESFSCLGILLPTFVPKMIDMNAASEKLSRNTRGVISSTSGRPGIADSQSKTIVTSSFRLHGAIAVAIDAPGVVRVLSRGERDRVRISGISRPKPAIGMSTTGSPTPASCRSAITGHDNDGTSNAYFALRQYIDKHS
jgi:hypothetical protein